MLWVMQYLRCLSKKEHERMEREKEKIRQMKNRRKKMKGKEGGREVGRN